MSTANPLMYRVLVCGDRDWTDEAAIWKYLDGLYEQWGQSLFIITGGARGADDIARDWAVSNHVDHITLYAKWDLFKKSAGPRRNSRMARLNPHLVVAFHDNLAESRGTKDMVKKAKAAKIRWKVVKHRRG